MAGQKELKNLASRLKRQLKGHPELFAPLADCYIKLGHDKEAEKLLVQGLLKLPHSVEGWLVQGNLHQKHEDHRKAREAFEEALKLDNNIPYAHEQCAALAATMSDEAGQELHLTELQRLAPLDDNTQSVLYTMQLRRLAVEKGLYSREEVERVIPGVLRQTLSEHNLLPTELERRSERPYLRFRTTDLDEDLVIVETVPGREEPSTTPPAATIHLDMPPAAPPLRRAESFETLTAGDEEVAKRFQPEGLGERTSRVNWAETMSPPKVTPQPPVAAPPAATPQGMVAHPAGSLEPPLASPPAPPNLGISAPVDAAPPGKEMDGLPAGTDFSPPPRESPIMRMLRGEMRERPVSREVKFFQEEPPAPVPHPPPKPPTLESARDLIAPEESEPAESPVQPAAPPPAPPLKPPVAETPQAPEPSPAAEPAAAAPQPTPAPPVHKELADVARQVTGAPAAAKPPEPAPKPTGERIATKTLAELYASQGDWKRAIEVYEQLLKKFPTNTAYQQRLGELKNKQEAARKG